MKILVILNSPPRCGKDSYVNLLTDYTHRRFKDNLVDLAIHMSGISREDWDRRYEASHDYGLGKYFDGWKKDIAWNRLGGLSQRGYLIWLSEKVMKLMHGPDVFGQRLKDDLDFENDMCGDTDFIISDGGFKEEVKPFIDDPEWKVVIIRLSRDGCTFENDSRRYLEDICDNEVDIECNGSISKAVEDIESFLNSIKGE